VAFDLIARLKIIDEATAPLRRFLGVTNQVESAFNQASRSATRAQGAMRSYENTVSNIRNRMNDFRNSVNSARNSMNSFKGNVDSGVGSLKALAGGIMAAVGAQKLLNATIGEAAKFEQSKVLIDAMFNDKKAADSYTKMVQRVAVQSPVLNSQDMFANSKSFISLSKNTKTLEQAWKVVEKLNVMDPAQGVEGAVLAVRELAGGDVQSLAERFEIPRKQLNAIKGLSFNEQVVALDKLLAKMNITDKVVEKMGSTTLAKWNQFKEKLSIGFRDMGMSALNYAKPAIDNLTKLLDSKAFGQFKNMVAQSLAGALNGINTLLTYVVQNKDKIVPVLTSISNGVHMVGSVIASVATLIINHWGTVKVVLAGVVAGFAALKAVAAVVSIFQMIIGVIKIFRTVLTVARAAMLLFNAAILMNPIAWLIAGIAAAIAIGVLLYRNWDKIKAKAAELWAGIKAKWASIKKSTADTWGNIQTKIGNAMSNAKKKVADFFSPLISFIKNAQAKWSSFKNALANFKMPSIHFPSLPSFGGGGGKKRSKGHFHGIDRIPYDGYQAVLHKDERVLTAKEADAYDKMQTAQIASATPVVIDRNPAPASISITIPKVADHIIVREEADIDRITNQLVTKLKAAWEAGA
jgi:dsDNA-binding SOS-regulon protein